MVATWLPFPAGAINSRDPKSLVRDRRVRRRFWKLFTPCRKAEGWEVCLPSFPSLRGCFSRERKGREPGYLRQAGFIPGLRSPWLPKKAKDWKDSAL